MQQANLNLTRYISLFVILLFTLVLIALPASVDGVGEGQQGIQGRLTVVVQDQNGNPLPTGYSYSLRFFGGPGGGTYVLENMPSWTTSFDQEYAITFHDYTAPPGYKLIDVEFEADGEHPGSCFIINGWPTFSGDDELPYTLDMHDNDCYVKATVTFQSGTFIDVYANEEGIPYSICEDPTGPGNIECNVYETTASIQRHFYTRAPALYMVNSGGGGDIQSQYETFNSVAGPTAQPYNLSTLTRNIGQESTFYINRYAKEIKVNLEAFPSESAPSTVPVSPSQPGIETVSIPPNQNTTLVWNSQGATSCSGTWTDDLLPTSGVAHLPRPETTLTHTLTCRGVQQ